MGGEVEKAKRVLADAEGLVTQAESALASTQELAKQTAAAVEALAQPELFDDGSFGVELAGLPEKATTRHGKYTGAELERRIVVRDEVVRLLAQGTGVRKIASGLRGVGVQCSANSILAFADRRKDLVETEKKRVSQGLGHLVSLSLDSIKERLIAGTFKPSSVDLAIFIDKKAQIDGEANLVVEHRFTVDASADAFAKRLDEMKRAKVGPPVESQAPAIDLKP